jgi:hypothetical protein
VREALPPFAAWRHRDARDGFEVVFLRSGPNGHEFEGATSAVEDGEAWAVEYTIAVDASWMTRSVQVVGRSASGRRELRLELADAGGWLVNGTPASDLRGCIDVDLESSSFTNALPVHRLGLEVGQAADAPAVYVRALDLAVERLEQRYVRIEDERLFERYDYSAPRFGYAGQLAYDSAGLILEYPGIAERVA